MSNIAIRVQHLSKEYQKGILGYNTIREQISYRWAKLQHRGDPNSIIGSEDSCKEGCFFALNDVSFEVKEGETFGIVGNNGSGKSTLLKILSQITTPSAGIIEIKGKVASLLEVGTGFHPEMTGRENVYLNGAILGMSRSEINRKFDEIVDFSGVESFIDTPVKRYSSGMYVRLAFSVAVHLDSDIVILDEVLAVGDAQFQKKCLAKIAQISKAEGRTVLFVSHSASSVKNLCQRCLWLDHGKKAAEGNATDIINQYIGAGDDVLLHSNVVWADAATAPQNDSIIMKSVSLCDRQGNPFTTISTHDCFLVAIDFQTRRSGVYVGFACIMNDDEGLPFLSSLSNQVAKGYNESLGEGTYRAYCEIPADLLNNIPISININFFGRNYTDLVSLPKVLRVQVVDHPALRGDYSYGFGGVLRPRFQWSIEERMADERTQGSKK